MRARFAIVVFAVLPFAASAQVVPQGATPEAVTRTLGAPRSRSAAKNREIWLYPGHQVVFENGRMISLLALPAEGAAVEWQKVPRPAPAPISVKNPTGPARSDSIGRTPQGLPGTAATNGARATKEGAPVKATAGKVLLRSGERRPSTTLPPAPNPATGYWPQFVIALIACGVVGGVVAWGWIRQRRIGALRNGRRSDDSSRDTSASSGFDDFARRQAAQGNAPAADVRAPALADWELTPDLLRTMEWKRFELIVERYYAASGFLTKNAGVGADNGVDLYLFRAGGQRPMSCVQCKAWGRRRVDVTRVRELFCTMSSEKISEGVVVTTGGFTSDALAFGRQNRIALIGGDEFIARFNRLPPMVRQRILREITDGDFTTPSCPRCGVKLALRLRPEDQSAYWTCQTYPKCHYTMTVRPAEMERIEN
jgi:hypothetical protein